MAVMLISGRKDEDQAADIIDIPKRTTPAKGKERPKFEYAVKRNCKRNMHLSRTFWFLLHLPLLSLPSPHHFRSLSCRLSWSRPCRLRAVVPARGGPHLHLSAQGVQEPHRARSLGWSRSEPLCWTLDCKNHYPLFSCSISQH